VAPEARPQPRRRLHHAALAILIPGLAAALLTLGLLTDESTPRAETDNAERLAGAAQGPPKPRRGPLLLTSLPFVPVHQLERPSHRPAPPVRLTAPSAGLRARIEPVDATREGIEVPRDTRAGWFAGGPRPGEPGRAVIVGHRDSKDGPAVFAPVATLEPGAPLEVTDRDGAVHRYLVVGTTQVTKQRFPSREVYGRASRPVLVLITCGGPYTPGVGYRDNVLVYARAA